MAAKKIIHRNLIECQRKVLKNSHRASNTFAPSLVNNCPLPDAKFDGKCLRQISISAHRILAN